MKPRHPTGEQGELLLSNPSLHLSEKISENFFPFTKFFLGPDVNSPSTKSNKFWRFLSLTNFFIFSPKWYASSGS